MATPNTVGLNEVQSRPIVTVEDVNKRVVLAYPHVGKWVGKLLDVFPHPNQADKIIHRVLIGNTAQNFVDFAPRALNDGEEFIVPTLTADDLRESMEHSGAFVAAKSLKRKSAAAQTAERAPKEVVVRFCASGSGKQTRGGAFAPGGDATLKSLLLKVERGQAEVSAIAEISREYILATPHWNERWGYIFADGFTPTPVAKVVKARKPASAKAAPVGDDAPVVEEAGDDEEFVEEEDVMDDSFEDEEDLDEEDEDELFDDEDESDEDDE